MARYDNLNAFNCIVDIKKASNKLILLAFIGSL